MLHHEATPRCLPVLPPNSAFYRSLQDSTSHWSSAVIPICSSTGRLGKFELSMRAVWECRSVNQVPGGSYLHLTLSFDKPPTILQKRLSAFAPPVIHKRKILQHITSFNLPQKKKRSKHLPRLN